MLDQKHGEGGRLVDLCERLTVLHASCRFDALVYERPFAGHFSAIGPLYHYEAIILYWAGVNKIPCRGFAPGMVKSSFTGAGRASKERMLEAAAAFGFAPSDDHQADAIALHRLVSAEIKKAPDFLTPQPTPKRRRSTK